MALRMRLAATALLAVFLALAIGGCKSPPHTDSTKGTAKQERSDTGMHGNHM